MIAVFLLHMNVPLTARYTNRSMSHSVTRLWSDQHFCQYICMNCASFVDSSDLSTTFCTYAVPVYYTPTISYPSQLTCREHHWCRRIRLHRVASDRLIPPAFMHCQQQGRRFASTHCATQGAWHLHWHQVDFKCSCTVVVKEIHWNISFATCHDP